MLRRAARRRLGPTARVPSWSTTSPSAAGSRPIRRDFVANISHELKTPVGALACWPRRSPPRTTPRSPAAWPSACVNEAFRRRPHDRRPARAQPHRGRGGAGHEPVPCRTWSSPRRSSGSGPRPSRRGITVDGRRAVAAGSTVLGDRRQLVSALAQPARQRGEVLRPGRPTVEVAGPHRRRVGRHRRAATTASASPPRDLERVFERFYRVDRARSRETGGTGLGLAIVRHVATNHGGEVRVESREGEGSTFTLRLPAGARRRRCRLDRRRARPASSMSDLTPTTTVLVVEDEDSLHRRAHPRAAARGLPRAGGPRRRRGARPVRRRAARPRAARRDAAEGVGHRRVPRAPQAQLEVPIIMVTAKGAEIDTVVGLEVGADDYVTKPYRLRELVARMRAVLRRGAARRRRRPCRAARSLEVGDVRLDPERHEVMIRGEHVHAAAQGVRAARAAARQRRPGAAPATRSSTGSGAPTTWATPRRSTSTSSGCGPRSRTIRPTPTRIVTIRGLGYKYEVPRD